MDPPPEALCNMQRQDVTEVAASFLMIPMCSHRRANLLQEKMSPLRAAVDHGSLWLQGSSAATDPDSMKEDSQALYYFTFVFVYL